MGNNKKGLIIIGVLSLGIVIGLGAIAYLLIENGGIGAFSNSSQDYKSFMKDEKIEKKIGDIIEIEEEMKVLSYEESNYFEEVNDLLEEHKEAVGDLTEIVEETYFKDEVDSELNEDLAEWCDLRVEANEAQELLIGLLHKLEALNSEDEIEEVYSKVVSQSVELEIIERQSGTSLSEFEELILETYDMEMAYSQAYDEETDLLSKYQIPTNENVINSQTDTSGETASATGKIASGIIKPTPSEETVPAIDYKEAYLLPRGHDDRYPLALAISQYDNMPNDQLGFLRYMSSDGEWAFVIASPGNDEQLINQYVAHKENGTWTIVEKYFAYENVRDVVLNDVPLFNMNTLPSYNVSDYIIYYLSEDEQATIGYNLYISGYISSIEDINYFSRVNDYALIIFKNGQRFLLEMDSNSLTNCIGVWEVSVELKFSDYHFIVENYGDGQIFLFIQD